VNRAQAPGSIYGGHAGEAFEYACAHVKISISLPDVLVSFADSEAIRRGTTRSGLLAQLLEEVRVGVQVTQYLDRYGWDVAEDEDAWRVCQAARMAQQYGHDEW
jgi:hypothetical protein